MPTHYVAEHSEDLFDEKYPPDNTLPLSDEYDNGDGSGCYGKYGKSEHDIAIVQAANPKCVWSCVSGDDGLYLTSGCRVVNWEWYYISATPRPDVEDDFEEYLIATFDYEDDEEESDRPDYGFHGEPI